VSRNQFSLQCRKNSNNFSYFINNERKKYHLIFCPYVVWALVPAVSAALVNAILALWQIEKLRLPPNTGALLRQNPHP